jgi:hypothetical protein
MKRGKPILVGAVAVASFACAVFAALWGFTVQKEQMALAERAAAQRMSESQIENRYLNDFVNGVRKAVYNWKAGGLQIHHNGLDELIVAGKLPEPEDAGYALATKCFDENAAELYTPIRAQRRLDDDDLEILESNRQLLRARVAAYLETEQAQQFAKILGTRAEVLARAADRVRLLDERPHY